MGDGVSQTRQRGGIRAPETQDVESDFGVGEEPVPEIVRKIRVGG